MDKSPSKIVLLGYWAGVFTWLCLSAMVLAPSSKYLLTNYRWCNAMYMMSKNVNLVKLILIINFQLNNHMCRISNLLLTKADHYIKLVYFVFI